MVRGGRESLREDGRNQSTVGNCVYVYMTRHVGSCDVGSVAQTAVIIPSANACAMPGQECGQFAARRDDSRMGQPTGEPPQVPNRPEQLALPRDMEMQYLYRGFSSTGIPDPPEAPAADAAC